MADSSTPKPVYVLHGSDAFLLDTRRKAIVDRLVGSADPQLCLSRFDDQAPLAEVLDELRTLPFLAPHRVVVIAEADAFVTAHRVALEDYLQKPTASASLILQVSSWRSNTRLAKKAAEIGEVLDCSAPGGRDLAKAIEKLAKRRENPIDRQAVGLLMDWIGEDLAALDGEIEKLSLYAGPGETITAEHVGKLVVASAGPAAFALTNALTALDPAGAVGALDGMLTVRGEEFKVMGMIAWHLRRALKGRQLADAGQSPDGALPPRFPPAQKRAFAQLCQRRSRRAFQGDYRKLIATDLAMKSGADPKAALQKLLVEMCV